MSQRIFKLGSLYGKRFIDRKVKKFGLPSERQIKEWHIVSGDTVQVIDGPEKGKIGQVLHVLRKHNKLVVKDVNVHIRTKKMTPVRAGFFYKTETPIHYSNVQLLDPILKIPTRIKIGKDELGKNVRYSTTTGAVIPKMRLEFTPRDKTKVFNPKLDTKPDDVWKVTYKPFTVEKPTFFNKKYRVSGRALKPMSPAERKARATLQRVIHEVVPRPIRR